MTEASAPITYPLRSYAAKVEGGHILLRLVYGLAAQRKRGRALPEVLVLSLPPEQARRFLIDLRLALREQQQTSRAGK